MGKTILIIDEYMQCINVCNNNRIAYYPTPNSSNCIMKIDPTTNISLSSSISLFAHHPKQQYHRKAANPRALQPKTHPEQQVDHVLLPAVVLASYVCRMAPHSNTRASLLSGLRERRLPRRVIGRGGQYKYCRIQRLHLL